MVASSFSFCQGLEQNHVIGVIVEEKRNLLWVFLNDHLVRMFLEQHLGCQQHIFVVIDYQDFAKFFITHSRRGMMVSTKVHKPCQVVKKRLNYVSV